MSTGLIAGLVIGGLLLVGGIGYSMTSSNKSEDMGTHVQGLIKDYSSSELYRPSSEYSRPSTNIEGGSKKSKKSRKSRNLKKSRKSKKV